MPVSSYEFEEFELDLRRYELRRSGRPLKVEKIPMELLILLVTRNGDLVSREEIVEKLWGRNRSSRLRSAFSRAIRRHHCAACRG